MNHKVKNLFLGFIVALVVIGWGTLEDWYGRTFYAQDALGYLDSSTAISHGDWTLALTPQWSIGYPLILSATRWLFPAGPEGEWISIHIVNLVIFLATYLSFLYFLKVASTYTAAVNGAESKSPEESWNGCLLCIGTSIFLLWELLIGNVSRVSPDLAISGLFFLVTATCLNFFMRPAAKTAVIMGLLMGLGYVLKAGFVPASALTLLIVIFHALIRSPQNRVAVLSKLAWAIPVMALVSLPYVVALSKSVGHFTLGESGGINYAWHVNHLPSYCDWQGGPAPFGTPLHPTQLVLKDPPVFTFAEPFHVTYPPWYNITYFYEGYHHFFSVKNQVSAVTGNLSTFRRFFFEGAHGNINALAAAILLGLGLFLLKERRLWWKRLIALWPLYLLTIAPISIYLLVHIEPRYVVGPMIALLVIPFLPLFAPTQLISRTGGYALTAFLVVGCAVMLAVDTKEAFSHAIHGQTNTNDGAWKIAQSLSELGVHPGDKVAAVGLGSSLDDAWAYVAGVHIVGEIGNYAFDPENQDKDLQLFASSPEVQETVFNLFRQAGAVVVVARDLDQSPQGPGWIPAPAPHWWIHRL